MSERLSDEEIQRIRIASDRADRDTDRNELVGRNRKAAQALRQLMAERQELREEIDNLHMSIGLEEAEREKSTPPKGCGE